MSPRGGVFWPLGLGKPIITVDVLRLTPKGRRAVGQWPFDQPAEVFIRRLEAVLISLPKERLNSSAGHCPSGLKIGPFEMAHPPPQGSEYTGDGSGPSAYGW